METPLLRNKTLLTKGRAFRGGRLARCFWSTLGVFLNTIQCATLRGPPRGRADRVRWLLGPRCVLTDGRVEVCAKSVSTLAKSHTFEQQVLEEQHSHQTFGQ